MHSKDTSNTSIGVREGLKLQMTHSQGFPPPLFLQESQFGRQEKVEKLEAFSSAW